MKYGGVLDIINEDQKDIYLMYLSEINLEDVANI